MVLATKNFLEIWKDQGKYPCSYYDEGVEMNAILCIECDLWYHKKCFDVKNLLKEKIIFVGQHV